MIFYEKEHLYKDGEIAYTSVSRVLHKLEKPKNWKLIAKRYATKVGKTVAEVEAEWKEENDKSTTRGKVYHAKQQEALNFTGVVHRRNVICNVKFHPIYQVGEGDWQITQEDTTLENNTVYTEFMSWDEESQICGTADEVEVINNTLNINDHKTNKEIKMQGFSSPGGRERLLYPVAHLDDCNWNKYCLQLSLYMYMLWKKNKHLKIGKLTLNHVRFDKEGNVNNVIPMDVPYLRDEVRDITAWWKTQNQ